MKQLIFSILILVLSNNLFGQHSRPDTLIAMPFAGQVKLDGQLNEPFWSDAPVIDNFTQREQSEGMPATEKTRVAVVYNANEMYIGIWCFDSEPDKISAQQMSRDFSWGSDDNIEIMISPFNDNRNGYLFVTNPNGALADVWVGDEGKDFNKDWNGVWDVAVKINEQGWFAEIFIPFSTLKFTKDSTQVWGVNFDITPTFKLNFTANTDFAQVESDRKQINLTRFSLYYPEKRQFFLEGKNYYDLSMGSVKLFYSRKIGIDQNNAVPIIGGARLFGKLNHTNTGVMSLQTYERDSIPTTNYSIIRVKQDIFKQSGIGFITTQKYSSKGYNRVYGTDFTYSTSQIFGNRNLIMGGEFALSETKVFGNNENLNKDNLSYNVFLSYPNDVIEYDFGFRTVEKGFNPEMGFTNRNNYQMLYTELQINPRFKSLPFFRNLIFKPIDINYYINEETKETESIFYEWRPFGFESKSGEFMEFNTESAIKPERTTITGKGKAGFWTKADAQTYFNDLKISDKRIHHY